MVQLVYLVPLLPLVGFIVLGLFGKKLKNESLIGGLASAMVGISFLIAVSIFFSMVGMPAEERSHTVTLFNWIQAGNFSVNLAYLVDPLSILFTLVITGVGFLIHIYSIGYMHGDRSFYRFFAYLNLFIFMMLNLVLADNFLVTFLGWEGVGLASYLLIGFWYDRKFGGTQITWTGDAAKKAFIMNRVGDFGMLAAMFILYSLFGSLKYADVNMMASMQFPGGSALITAATLLLFLGCTGKSAQIPLFVWLPDAMAGPTPVSALIHAATMVTSGIFLMSRTSALFALAPDTMAVVAVVGISTALLSATIGVVQNDIKKVLAYSTVSQLGLMFVALGVGGFTAAVFHVMTHAFFKALLFLGSGSVIHGMHEEQDIQKMGGLKKYMPTTYKTFLIGSIAIAGIFPFSGFFSKDEIFWFAFDKGSGFLWFLGVCAAFLTAFYMFRLVNLTFNGKERFDHHVHPHESPATMTIPLQVLALLAIIGGFVGIPHALGHPLHIPNLLEHWLEPVFKQANESLRYSAPSEIHPIEYLLMAISLGVGISGIVLGNKLYGAENATPAETAQKFAKIYKLLWKKYFVDEIYYGFIVNPLDQFSRMILWKGVDVNVIDGIVDGSGTLVSITANLLRRLQTGIVQNYMMIMVIGVIAALSWLLVV